MPAGDLLVLVRAEYLEMPGLRLTLEQAQRLCGVERALCQHVLDALVQANFLRVHTDGTYARVTEGTDRPQPRPAKAHLENHLSNSSRGSSEHRKRSA
jgi:hypothetical protein